MACPAEGGPAELPGTRRSEGCEGFAHHQVNGGSHARAAMKDAGALSEGGVVHVVQLVCRLCSEGRMYIYFGN